MQDDSVLLQGPEVTMAEFSVWDTASAYGQNFSVAAMYTCDWVVLQEYSESILM